MKSTDSREQEATKNSRSYNKKIDRLEREDTRDSREVESQDSIDTSNDYDSREDESFDSKETSNDYDARESEGAYDYREEDDELNEGEVGSVARIFFTIVLISLAVTFVTLMIIK